MLESMSEKDRRKLRLGLRRAELYYAAHPGSPSAVRRPEVMLRGSTWIALLGASLDNGILGLGNSVEAALRAFDTQYLNFLHAPADALAA